MTLIELSKIIFYADACVKECNTSVDFCNDLLHSEREELHLPIGDVNDYSEAQIKHLEDEYGVFWDDNTDSFVVGCSA